MANNKRMRKVMLLSWDLQRSKDFGWLNARRRAVTMAHRVVKTRLLMSKGWTEIMFCKKDGQVVRRTATTNLALVPAEMQPDKIGGMGTFNKNWLIQNYFDEEMGAWRSYDIRRLM